MTDLPISLLLLSVPSLPMLLAIPALRRRLPRPLLIALLPAMILLVVPGTPVIEFPWILVSGSAYGIDVVSRWWLAMSIVMWMAAGSLLQSHGDRDAGTAQRTNCLLLCQSGQSGVLLATDLVSFFAFATLMGYAFFGLLSDRRDATAKRAAQAYIVLLVLADLVLFEVLLIALTVTQDLKFARSGIEIASSSSAGLYVALVSIGFALKAGLWPAHVWLPRASSANRPWLDLLLWLVPAATGLLGAIRWLPLGEYSAPLTGGVLQGLGAGAILYAIWLGLRQTHKIAYVIIAATGLAVMVIGAGLADPRFWEQYAMLFPIFIAVTGWALVIATLTMARRNRGRLDAVPGEIPTSDTAPWFVLWPGALLSWGRRAGFDTLPRWRAAVIIQLSRLARLFTLQSALNAGERSIQQWRVAITVFVLLGAVVVLSLG